LHPVSDFYSDRAFGRYRDHCDSGVNALARAEKRAGNGEANPVRKQPEATWHCRAYVCKRLQ
jgi:hypothetical protein